MTAHIDIVFDGPPEHEAGRFVEVEDAAGKSINVGNWRRRADGFWVLRIPAASTEALEAAERIAAFDSSFPRYDDWTDDLTQDAKTIASALLGIAR